MSATSGGGTPAARGTGDPSVARLLLAFAAVYVIWGSTYLGIKVAIRTMPPFVVASSRFWASAALMTLWALATGATRPRRSDLVTGGITGLLTLAVGNGSVSWAAQHIASGRIALLVALTPLWMTLIDWWRPGGHRPSLLEGLGLAVGLGGVALLVGPDALAVGGRGAAPWADLVAVLGSISWAAGSLVTRYRGSTTTAAMRTALQMWAAALALTAVALARGECTGFDPARVSAASWLAWGYLVTFGSLIGFSAYVWLLKVVPPSRAATYAYVNPAVALGLGWLLGGEPLGGRTLSAAAVIIAGVALVTLAPARPVPAVAEGHHTDEMPQAEG